MAATATGPEALRGEGLTKRYGDREALRGVSFSAARGEQVAIIGPNGAGKTTLLQILAGALAPSGGSVTVPEARVGWVPQQPALYSKLSVAENLRLFARLERRPDVEATVERMLDQTGLRGGGAPPRPGPGGSGCSTSRACATGRETRSAACRAATASGSTSPSGCSRS